jgi:hypothetical protein
MRKVFEGGMLRVVSSALRQENRRFVLRYPMGDGIVRGSRESMNPSGRGILLVEVADLVNRVLWISAWKIRGWPFSVRHTNGLCTWTESRKMFVFVLCLELLPSTNISSGLHILAV